jgi:hypothetical protein
VFVCKKKGQTLDSTKVLHDRGHIQFDSESAAETDRALVMFKVLPNGNGVRNSRSNRHGHLFSFREAIEEIVFKTSTGLCWKDERKTPERERRR